MMMTFHSGTITQSSVQSSNGRVHLKIADWLSKEPRPPHTNLEENTLLASARCPPRRAFRTSAELTTCARSPECLPSQRATRGLVKEGVLRQQVRQRVGGDVLAGIDSVCSVGGLNSGPRLNPVHCQLRYYVSLAKILSVLGIESVSRIIPQHTLGGYRLRATADVAAPWL